MKDFIKSMVESGLPSCYLSAPNPSHILFVLRSSIFLGCSIVFYVEFFVCFIYNKGSDSTNFVCLFCFSVSRLLYFVCHKSGFLPIGVLHFWKLLMLVVQWYSSNSETISIRAFMLNDKSYWYMWSQLQFHPIIDCF